MLYQILDKYFQNDFTKAFNLGIDAILTPTTPSSAFKIGDEVKKDPLEMYLNDVFTVTVNLAGLPAISVPSGKNKSGLPLGLQLIGQPWKEGELLQIAHILEKETNFSTKPIRWW